MPVCIGTDCFRSCQPSDLFCRACWASLSTYARRNVQDAYGAAVRGDAGAERCWLPSLRFAVRELEATP